MTAPTSASVLVTLKVKVHVGAWNEAATFASLRGQVIREAKQSLQTALQKHNDMDVVGEPVAIQVVLSGDSK
ncbi:hypothetical protein E2544_08620 [Achromobacter insolitus]|uniref:hypothetical protein n=1 Tax=Achromobacter insolitus TaxID=217204 RepID=UPI0011EB9B44|nr:hypothetical protein [Achromobacter insolitus]QEK91870.1 hypothetical protein E2544_08620 [Achromobacter insolitus]